MASIPSAVLDVRTYLPLYAWEDTNSIHNRTESPPLQLSIQSLPQRTPKRPSSEPHGATRQQAIAKTRAK
jgi:hypothetical protein